MGQMQQAQFPEQVPSRTPRDDRCPGFINPVLCPYLRGTSRKLSLHELSVPQGIQEILQTPALVQTDCQENLYLQVPIPIFHWEDALGHITALSLFDLHTCGRKNKNVLLSSPP